MIDPDTPKSAYTKKGGEADTLQLVFSDEFNVDGRTFYTGEDPFWEAVNLHYWSTANMEWSDPDAIITKDGYLQITLSQESLADSHNMGYLGGMLQSWNKFCLTGGRIEMAVSLPGNPRVAGFWPAGWLMGNLGRAGYGATLEGTWPFAYDSCDIGTLPNQTDPAGGPVAAITSGDPNFGNSLSYQPGQRLSRCTCPGEDHPGPAFANGTFKGRSAPEIDVFEAMGSSQGGEISQSAQWAPYNPQYQHLSATNDEQQIFTSTYRTFPNSYNGSVYQQSTSGVSYTREATYDSTTSFGVYQLEYQPSDVGGWGTGWIEWSQDDVRNWRLGEKAMAANTVARVGNRMVSNEPSYMIINLGMSQGFQSFDVADVPLPGIMRVDYVRVYQNPSSLNIGCDKPDYPTADYIDKHTWAYNNPNLTTWKQYKEFVNDTITTFPKNRLTDTC
ncbi:glycoside hydrolase family 16 protein [Meredithblackwellia eburnea MCA 4105]